MSESEIVSKKEAKIEPESTIIEAEAKAVTPGELKKQAKVTAKRQAPKPA
jgi:hypothetical protein